MRLKNKKTGEIAEASVENLELIVRYDDGRVEKYPLLFDYSNFEYYEEPKEYWWIDTGSIPMVRKSNNPILSTTGDIDKEIGNYFETKEEAEKAVEKLRAYKRLKDRGFEFCGWCEDIGFRFTKPGAWQTEVQPDLDLLFGGEE